MPFLGLGDVTEVYLKITEYHGYGTQNVNFAVGCFERIEVVNDDESISYQLKPLNIKERYFSFMADESGGENDRNTRQQGYEYLKTLPEFSEAIDC